MALPARLVTGGVPGRHDDGLAAGLRHAKRGHRGRGGRPHRADGQRHGSGWSKRQIRSLLTSGSWANNSPLGIDTTNGSRPIAATSASRSALTKLGANTLTLTASGPYGR